MHSIGLPETENRNEEGGGENFLQCSFPPPFIFDGSLTNSF